jgi:hypothetical protein
MATQLESPPDGLIITISQQMLKEKGCRNWLRNFLEAMGKHEESWTYWMRLGAVPKCEVLWVYLCIGNKIRYRTNFVMYKGPGQVTFNDGKRMAARAWVVIAGPVVKADQEYPRKGFRGFRYTEKIF